MLIDRVAQPPQAFASVEFDSREDAAAFVAPAWFGEDVSGDQGWSNRGLALYGAPDETVPGVSDESLDALLDDVESSERVRVPLSARPRQTEGGRPQLSAVPSTDHAGHDDVLHGLRSMLERPIPEDVASPGRTATAG